MWLFAFILSFCVSVKAFSDPDLHRGAVELIESRGFKAETHYVTTYDGYILTVHRILNPYTKTNRRPVVILQHGLTSCSRDFLVNSPGENVEPTDDADICNGRIDKSTTGNNLGFALSKMGLDVWLPNTRGSGYSQNHTILSTKEKAFWRFTFDDMVKYDLPAYIKYIMKATKEKSVAYVGHSEGGFLMLGLLATQPKYADIVKPYIGMAPFYSLKGSKTFFGLLRGIPYWLSSVLRDLGGSLHALETKKVFEHLCRNIVEIPCVEITFFGAGFDFKQANVSRLPVYLASPSETSVWNIAHYAQSLASQREDAAMFDYGKKGNQIHYGQSTPKVYNMSKITSKYLALMYGKNDWTITLETISLLKKALKVPLMVDYMVPEEDWNHLDFVAAKQTGFYVNSKILEILRQVLC